ncbi:MAG TPA: VOC family protein [Sphingobium sp.]|nr:VOC family protein [Sphingobium sp.]
MTLRMTPFLMFQGQATAALDLYCALFPDAVLDDVERYGAGQARPEGSVRRARLTLGGQTLVVFDSDIDHPFGFTPAISLFIDCDSETQLHALAEGLGEGGGVLMPVGDYGFSRLFTWVADRFGVSWQLNLS